MSKYFGTTKIGIRFRAENEVLDFARRLSSWGYDMKNANLVFGKRSIEYYLRHIQPTFELERFTINIIEVLWYDLLQLSMHKDLADLKYNSIKSNNYLRHFFTYLLSHNKTNNYEGKAYLNSIEKKVKFEPNNLNYTIEEIIQENKVLSSLIIRMVEEVRDSNKTLTTYYFPRIIIDQAEYIELRRYLGCGKDSYGTVYEIVDMLFSAFDKVLEILSMNLKNIESNQLFELVKNLEEIRLKKSIHRRDILK